MPNGGNHYKCATCFHTMPAQFINRIAGLERFGKYQPFPCFLRFLVYVYSSPDRNGQLFYIVALTIWITCKDLSCGRLQDFCNSVLLFKKDLQLDKSLNFLYSLYIFIPLLFYSGGYRERFLIASLGRIYPVAFRRLIYFDEGMLQPYGLFWQVALILTFTV